MEHKFDNNTLEKYERLRDQSKYSGLCYNERNWFYDFICYSNCSFQHTLKYMYIGVICSRPTVYIRVTIQHNPFQTHNQQHSYHPTKSVPDPHPTAQLPSNTIRSRPTTYNKVTIQHNPFQTHNLQHSYHPTQSVPDQQPTA
jgi:pectate lyase